jgi:hypothetical protein
VARADTAPSTLEEKPGRRSIDNDNWALVTAGSRRRASLAAVRALAAAGYRAAVTVSGPSLAASSRYCDRTVEVPPVTDAGYAPAVRAELERNSYVAVYPASDPALLALDGPGTHLMDKLTLAELARGAELEMPPSQLFDTPEDLLAAGDSLQYPVVVKPNIRRYFPRRVDSPSGLAAVVGRTGPVLVQPYLHDALCEVSGVMWGGRLVAASHHRCLRVWPVDCGTVTAAETVAPDAELEARLEKLLEGYSGVFQAQLMGPYLLDVNPMVHTSMPLALAGGVNLVGVHCDLVRGIDVTPVRARPGEFYRWLEGDWRSIVAAFRKRRNSATQTARALMPRRGAVHSTESVRDPGPLLARVWYGGALGRL